MSDETSNSMFKPGTAQAVTASQSSTQVIACWSDVGVYGNGSCAELPKVFHCRNCPVYSAAGVRAIDRPLPPNYRLEWSQHFAEEKRLPEQGNASAILFRIHREWLAMPTHTFQEVAEKRAIHSLPNRSGSIVLGLANVRGELVTCISLGHLLQIEGMPSMQAIRANYGRLLVVQSATSKLAFPADEVQGPHRFHPQQLKEPPATVARANARYAQAVLPWEKHAVGLMNAELLLSSLGTNLT